MLTPTTLGFIYGMKDACRALLEKHGITHAFFHAPLDDADFGTNASLAAALKLQGCRKALPQGVFMAGIIGELGQPADFERFEAELSSVLGEPVRSFKNNDRDIRRVCVATGGGNMTQDLKCAADSGCDAYVTGEYVLYSQQYARFAG
jgi:putative NIF3 family GTP cyclohydrolase 1 type 2